MSAFTAKWPTAQASRGHERILCLARTATHPRGAMPRLSPGDADGLARRPLKLERADNYNSRNTLAQKTHSANTRQQLQPSNNKTNQKIKRRRRGCSVKQHTNCTFGKTPPPVNRHATPPQQPEHAPTTWNLTTGAAPPRPANQPLNDPWPLQQFVAHALQFGPECGLLFGPGNRCQKARPEPSNAR